MEPIKTSGVFSAILNRPAIPMRPSFIWEYFVQSSCRKVRENAALRCEILIWSDKPKTPTGEIRYSRRSHQPFARLIPSAWQLGTHAHFPLISLKPVAPPSLSLSQKKHGRHSDLSVSFSDKNEHRRTMEASDGSLRPIPFEIPNCCVHLETGNGSK